MTEIKNPYLPELATVTKIIEETPTIKSFQVVLNDPEKMKNFSFKPGQVGQLSVFGVGESTFVINSSPTRMEYLQFIGLAPLRTLILYMLDNRDNYDDITIIYGARTPPDLCYKDELKEWEARSDVNLILTVDAEYPGWDKRVGFVPTVLNEVAPSPENTVAITCGPPIMIKFVLQGLSKLKFKDEQIITTLEKRMKCGIGICGRCNIGAVYVCKDGPVFSLAQLKNLPSEL